MAEKRMIAKSIIDSDIFLDMPVSAQNLYFHLNMRADDEGFIDSPRKIMRMVNCSNNDIDILLSKRYLLSFESGVIVIKHWRLHNVIRKERVKPTLYQEEKALLSIKENGAYTDKENDALDNCQRYVRDMSDNCQTTVSDMSEEIRLDYVRLDKTRLDQISLDDKRNFSGEWETIKKYWNNKKLPEYRTMIMHESNSGELLNLMLPYSYEEIIKAIDNYSEFLEQEEHPYQTFKGFMTRGIPRFFDGAKPWTRYEKKEQQKLRINDLSEGKKSYYIKLSLLKDKYPSTEKELDDWIKEAENEKSKEEGK